MEWRGVLEPEGVWVPVLVLDWCFEEVVGRLGGDAEDEL